ncbi:bifunctional folylpolyglutamate synthase/dihydrofolate synthase [Hydrogenimonas sp.]
MPESMNLNDFLQSKPLYYDKIDLSRMPRAYALVEKELDPGRIVHIIGTNGKGSTGRMLAELLRSRNLKVGHYSSPHILSFNERIWIEGKDISDFALRKAHERLYGLLPQTVSESLSYFEYTTLLALVAFEGLDIVVFEAGLGGEFDATSVVERELSVVTPIGMDHQAFLGETIKEIAATKLRSIAPRAVMAPQPFQQVYDVARSIAARKGSELIFTENLPDESARERIEKIRRKKGWPEFLSQNAATALVAAEVVLGGMPDSSALAAVTLRGRFEKIAPNVILDVGHNTLAAKAIAEALDGRKPVLVYNAYEDKEVETILEIFAPHVSGLELIEIQSPRAMEREKIVAAAERVGLKAGTFTGVDEKSDYLVFGSFAVAEAFLKRNDET